MVLFRYQERPSKCKHTGQEFDRWNSNLLPSRAMQEQDPTEYNLRCWKPLIFCSTASRIGGSVARHLLGLFLSHGGRDARDCERQSASSCPLLCLGREFVCFFPFWISGVLWVFVALLGDWLFLFFLIQQAIDEKL